jgi:uncharacterized Ntn-hydrolase superfamily protein
MEIDQAQDQEIVMIIAPNPTPRPRIASGMASPGRRFLLAWLLGLCLIPTTGNTTDLPQSPRAHTYSIVAHDPETGELGVAVQSHWFSVGPVVAWAEAGVGAVATQSLVNVSFGPLALQMLAAGLEPPAVLSGLLATDKGAALRQVAVMNAAGQVATHTGERCIPAAGHLTGDGYSVQANLMVDGTVWPAMAQAYESATGDLAERMLRALEAAEAAGGDIRGRQSAALIVVAAESSGRPWADRRIDLRVDDAVEPLVELRRLLRIHRAYEHMNRGDEALGTGDVPLAMAEYAAAADLYRGNPEIRYWQAVTMSGAGLLEDALPIFAEVFQADPSWRILTPRLRQVGLLEITDQELDRILAATGAEE